MKWQKPIKMNKKHIKMKPYEPQECQGCGEIRYVYEFKIGKKTELWCRECIDSFEMGDM